MQFNYSIHETVGKVIFAVFDVLAMAFLYLIVKRSDHSKKIADKNAGIAVKLYAYNPLFVALTVRGSCESITLALMYAFWYYYFGGETTGNQAGLHTISNKINESQPKTTARWLSYLIYGLWVHVRVYPIILLPLLLVH
jgi:hypothetical protein